MKPLKKINVSTSAEARHKDLAHYGIIAAAIDELGIVSMINKLIPPSENQIISTGEAIAAIIINFLSTGDQQRLYITSSFFNTVAVEHLFRPGIIAKDFNDDTLGRSLDRISKLGSSMVYSTIMVAAAEKLNLMGKYVHMDTTSISTYGEYGDTEDIKFPKLIDTQDNAFSAKENNVIWEGKKSEGTEASWEFSEPYEEDIELKITHGYSKQHRMDLKQFIINMTLSGPAKLPLFMQCLNGNASDKNSFASSIEQAQAYFKGKLNAQGGFIWVLDSAFYSKKNFIKLKNTIKGWITRVPHTLQEAKKLLKKDVQVWKICADKNYQYHEIHTDYANLQQRWVLVFSKAAYSRDVESFKTKFDLEYNNLKQIIATLSRQTFKCTADAKKALKKAISKIKYFAVIPNISEIKEYAKPGKPAKNTQADIVGYKISGTIIENKITIETAIASHGKFIIATDILDQEELPAEEIFTEYKKQSTCEGAFKFLKNPKFLMHKVFLKTPSRIDSMMMVMTLAVAVAHFVEYKLKTILILNKDTVPNKANKQTDRLTFDLLVFIMKGISVISLLDPVRGINFRCVSTINEIQKKVIRYFGEIAEKIYTSTNFLFASGFI